MAFVINNGVLERYDPEPYDCHIVIPDNVVKIGDGVFRQTKIMSVTIPSSVKVIGVGAFESCIVLMNVILSNGLEKIQKKAFSRCMGITDIEIPETVKVIGEEAFSKCRIKDITIPSGVKNLNKFFCRSCERLENINVSEYNTNYTSVDGILFSKDRKTFMLYPCARKEICYSIPDGVTAIQSFAFENCRNLESVIIPASVNWIEKHIFSFCPNLKHLTLPDSNMVINDYAFTNDNEFSDITIAGKKTSIKVTAKFMTPYTFLIDAMRFVRCVTAPPHLKSRFFAEIKGTEYRIPLAVFLAIEYDDPIINVYLKKIIRRAVKYLADTNDSENLTKILDSGYIMKANIDELISYAIVTKKPEIQLILSNFKNDMIGFEKKGVFDDLLL